MSVKGFVQSRLSAVVLPVVPGVLSAHPSAGESPQPNHIHPRVVAPRDDSRM